MNFKEAIDKLNEGKKIRRTCWEYGHYWVLNENKRLVNSVGDNPILNRKQMQMDDWEVINRELIISNKTGKVIEKEELFIVEGKSGTHIIIPEYIKEVILK